MLAITIDSLIGFTSNPLLEDKKKIQTSNIYLKNKVK